LAKADCEIGVGDGTSGSARTSLSRPHLTIRTFTQTFCNAPISRVKRW
jgi:hypothetical protein